MGNVVFWEDSPVAWQTVKIAGTTLPGWAKVTGDIERQVKRDLVPGKDGYTYNHLGYKGARVTIVLTMWLREHLTAWEKIAKALRPYKGSKNADPVDVYHPALETLAIRSLYVIRIGIPEPSGTQGVYQVTLEFEEFIREAQRFTKSGKAKTSQSGGIVGQNTDYSQPAAITPSSNPPAPS